MMNAEAVQAVAEALSKHWRDMHTNESLGLQRMLATHAVAAAEPHLTREAKVATDEAQAKADVLRAALNVALNDGDPEALEGARLALDEVRREDLTLLHERNALAARLAAVEALADRMAKIHYRLDGDVEINHHEHLRSARDHVRTLHDDLRAALATGATTNQQEVDQ